MSVSMSPTQTELEIKINSKNGPERALLHIRWTRSVMSHTINLVIVWPHDSLQNKWLTVGLYRYFDRVN